MKSLLLFVCLSVATRLTAAWSFDESAMTATDGNWTIKLGYYDNGYGFYSITAGSGDLDLTDFERDTGIKITRCDSYSRGKAFAVKSNIKSLKAPDIVSVGYSEFWRCSAITNIYLPSAITFGEYAFNECKELVSLTISSEAKSFPKHFAKANAKMVSLTPTEFPNLTKIGDSAFYGCSRLEVSLSLPNLTTIDTHAFYNCSKFRGIYFPKLTTLGRQAFCYTSSLEKLSPLFPDTLASISGDSLFFRNSVSRKFVQEEPLRIANPNITVIGEYFMDGVADFTMPFDFYSPIATIQKNAFTTLPKGQIVNFYSDVVPTFAASAMHTAGKGKIVFYIHSQNAISAWKERCEALAETFESSKTASDYPGIRTIGLVDCSGGSGTYAWVVSATEGSGTTMIIK